MKTPILLFALALGLVAAPAPAQVTTKGGKSLLRMKWTKGKSFRYAVTVTAMVPGQKRPMNQAMSLNMDVLDVKGNIGTVKCAVKGASGNDTTDTVKIDSKGKVSGKSEIGQLLIPLPEKAVAVGESWKDSTVGTNPMYGKSTVNMVLTYRGIKTIKGKKLAEVSVTTTVSGSAGIGKGMGTVEISPEDGMVQSMEQSLSMQMKTTDSKGKTQTTDLPVKVSVVLQ